MGNIRRCWFSCSSLLKFGYKRFDLGFQFGDKRFDLGFLRSFKQRSTMVEEESNQRKSTMEEESNQRKSTMEEEEEEEGSNSSSTVVVSAEMETATAGVVGVAGNNDMISRLPDDLLHCIFSFLDIDYAIKCSVLSKRWRYLWITLPYLNFNLEIPYTHDNYTSKLERRLTEKFWVFVDSVLSRRNGCTDTCTFRIKYTDANKPEYLLNKWIQYAILHNVEVFDITSESEYVRCDYDVEDDFTIIPSLINDLCTASKSLRSLKLKIDYCQERIKTSFGLPCLKYMHLESIRFVYIEDLSHLVSRSCPVLETLIVSACIFGPCSENLAISSPQLKHLEMANLFCYNDSVDLQEYQRCNITVSSPKLVYFECVSPLWMMHNYTLGDVSSLMKACIYVYGPTSSKDSSERTKQVINLLRGLANVKSLSFGPHESLFQALFEIPQQLSTTFHSLSFLKLTLSQPLELREVRAIAHLLEKCPNVERFVLLLYTDEFFSYPKERKHEAADFPSQFMLLHLKHVEIQNALGGEEELELIAFLKKNTVQLEELVVIPRSGSESGSTIS